MMMRESLGIMTEGQGGVFSTRCVKKLFDRSREPLPMDTQHVYTAIDPTGGGPSKFAIVSGIRFGGKLQVYVALLAPVWYHTVSCMQIYNVKQILKRQKRCTSCS